MQINKKMKESDLLNGEILITEADNGLIVLTNKRIRMQKKDQGKESLVSIMLKNVASVSMKSQSFPQLLIVAAIIVFASIYMSATSEPYIVWFGVVLAAALVITHYYLRRYWLVINSIGGAQIQFHIKHRSSNEVHKFIHQLEGAIDKYAFSKF